MNIAKKILVVILCVMLLFLCFQVITFANTASVMTTNIESTISDLSISGINSTSYAKLIVAKSMSLSIKMELQKLKSGTYTTIETWNASKTGISLSMSETRLINVLANYRLKVTFKAGSETLVRYAYP